MPVGDSYGYYRIPMYAPNGAGGYRAKMNQRKRRKMQRRAGNGRRRKK